MPTKVIKTASSNKKRRASKSPPKEKPPHLSQTTSFDSDDEETEWVDTLEVVPSSQSKKAKIQPSDVEKKGELLVEEEAGKQSPPPSSPPPEEEGENPPAVPAKEGQQPPADEGGAEAAPPAAVEAPSVAGGAPPAVERAPAPPAVAGNAPPAQGPLEFRSFASPVRNGANPYYIHFQLVNRRLVSFYLSRSRFGNAKTYATHLLRTAVQKNEAWIRRFNVSDDDFYLHVDGVPQPHYPGARYNKRCFLIDGLFNFRSEQEFIDFVRPIAETIIQNLNKKLNHDSKVAVPPTDLELIKILDDSVLADVIGVDAACEKLLGVLGEDYEASKFDANKDVVYSFFKAGSIPRRIGAILGCSESDMEEQPIYN